MFFYLSNAMIRSNATSIRSEATERAGGLYCEVVSSLIDLQILVHEWESLFLEIPNASMCAHPEWTVSWWTSFGHEHMGAGEDTQLYVLTFRNVDRELVGVVPLYEDQPKNAIRLRSIGYLGRERAYDMTEEPTVLVRPGFEALVSKCLQKFLKQESKKGRWDFIALINAIEMPLNEDGSWQKWAFVRSGLRSGSDFVDLPETWSEYRKRLSKSMRENLPYYPRLLNRDGHNWTLRTVEHPTEIRGAVERLAGLHQSRAESCRGRQHSNHLHTDIQIKFLSDLLSSLAEQGRAFVTELVVDDRVIASQAFYGMPGMLTVSYSGFDEAFYKYSPIFIISASVFQDAQVKGVRKLNLLRNIAPWKTRWLAHTGDSMTRTYLVRKRPISILRYLWHTGCIGFERDVIRRIPVLVGRLKRSMKKAGN